LYFFAPDCSYISSVLERMSIVGKIRNGIRR
jgi:hypothetical protein